MKSKLAMAIALLLASGGASGEDLLAVYQDALRGDPLIREADANRSASREARPQAWSALLPQLSAFGSYEKGKTETVGTTAQERLLRNAAPNDTTFRSEIDQITINRTTEPTVKQWSVDLRQNVFSWANWVELRRASSVVAQAEADYQAAQQDLILRVSERYFDVLAARDNVDAEQAAQEAISRQLDQANKRFEVGLIAITDVQEAQAARDSAVAAVIAAKRELATAEELLREITDRQYSELAKPAPDMNLKTPDPNTVENWVEVAMDQNLALISSRLASDIARSDVRSTFGGHFPTIDLVGSKSKVESDADLFFPERIDTLPPRGAATFPNNTETDDRSIALQVSIPIFSGGFTQSRVRESQFRWIAAVGSPGTELEFAL